MTDCQDVLRDALAFASEESGHWSPSVSPEYREGFRAALRCVLVAIGQLADEKRLGGGPGPWMELRTAECGAGTTTEDGCVSVVCALPKGHGGDHENRYGDVIWPPQNADPCPFDGGKHERYWSVVHEVYICNKCGRETPENADACPWTVTDIYGVRWHCILPKHEPPSLHNPRPENSDHGVSRGNNLMTQHN